MRDEVQLVDHFIKVCGVTRPADLQTLAEAEVQAVGFNFVPSSPRCLETEQALALSKIAGRLGLCRVGVVLDPDEGRLTNLLDTVELDMLQLHGREPPEIQDACRGLPIIKAITWSGRVEERQLAEQWADASTISAFLVDAFVPGQAGGTGKLARWDLLQPRPDVFGELPLILAGGLTADNVQQAIVVAHCDGVDTASGVEVEAGVKAEELVVKFASNARQAWGQS